MSWRPGIMAALLAWLFLVGPAAAALTSRTDSQGVLHISNVSPAKLGPSRPESPPEAAGLEAMVRLPEPAAPPAQAVEKSQPAAASATTPTPEAAAPIVVHGPEPAEKAQPGSDSPQKVCHDAVGGPTASPVPGIIGMVAAAAAVETVPPAAAAIAAEAGPGLLKKVSFEEAETEAVPAPAPQAATPKAEIITAGGIRRYRDARGVWHISNLTPGDEGSGPARLEAGKRPSPDRATPENQPPRPAALEAGLPLKKVAWSPDNPELATLPVTKTTPRKAAPAEANLIRRYRDSHGVIHIENVGPELAAPMPAPVAPARLAPGEAQPLRWRQAALVEGEAPLILKPVAWSGEGGISPLRPAQAAASGKARITTEGGIQRWQDKKGVWHIMTVEYPRPEAMPQPAAPAEPKRGTQVAGGPPSLGAPGAQAGVSQAPPSAYGAPVPTVTAFRDRQGRLKITNDAPVTPGQKASPPGAAPAPAALEPLIAEAAQVHQLPASLIRAVIKTESDFCSWAVSPKGAMGLMQLMPGTAAFLGVQEPFNPRENIHGGCRYLRLLINSFGGSVPLALAAYNAGYQRVINCGYQVPPIKETQDFVTQVMGRYVAEEKRTHLPWT